MNYGSSAALATDLKIINFSGQSSFAMTSMDTAHSILRSAKHFFAGTLLSRFSGLFRDVTMAFCFGSSPKIAAFMVAYRLANLFRRILGESSLQAGFIPHFEALRKEHPKEAFLFYRDTAFSLAVLLLGVVFGLEIVLFSIEGHLTQGWKEIAILTEWMVPGLLFICLFALHNSLLQCQKKYFSAAFAPVLFNGVWIVFAITKGSIQFLSFGITIAFFAQWLLTAFKVKKEWGTILNWQEWFRPKLFSLEWKKIIGPMVLGILGVSAMQINSAVDAIFARIADPQGPAFLWYAIRVQQLPLALFGIALSGALLPPLSRAMQEGDFSRYKELLVISLKRGTVLMVPCMFGIFALGPSGLNLLYGRGGFSSEDVRQTLLCLWAYGIGLIPAAFTLLLATSFYAKKAYKKPTFATCFSIGMNLGLNALMVFWLQLGAVSIALATSLSVLINCAILFSKTEIGSDFWRYFVKVFIGGGFAAFFTMGVGLFLGDGTILICLGEEFLFPHSFSIQLMQFGVLATVFAGSFLAVAKVFRVEEIFVLLWSIKS
ncbi:MAG: murein biosynthesis integral membrane protein MurJ [Chlamydiae bacterium]|nr:murein biosynthesis integral membrane protein MurJ [Chlamydiota bacterium]